MANRHRGDLSSQAFNVQPFNNGRPDALGRASLAMGVEFRHWAIAPASVRYQNDAEHTLSLYLRGGQNSYRQDQRGNLGGPDKLCLMPQGGSYSWQLVTGVEFAHFYFNDAVLKAFATQHFDRDARQFELTDFTYLDKPLLQRMFHACLQARDPMDALAREQLCSQLFYQLLAEHNAFRLPRESFSGGLSPVHRRRMNLLIEDQLDQKLSLAELAHACGLSPYHFARMFKQSFGLPPAQYVQWRRVERIKALLAGPTGLSQISSLCGFSQQSHMTVAFRQHTGVTPSHYRQLLRA